MAKEPFVCKLVVLGDGGVGKTALISRLRFKRFVQEFDPTIEDSCTIDVVVNNQPCRLEILDTAGVDEYSHLRDVWIRVNEGFMLVYSVSSRPSFVRIQGLYDQIQRIKKSTHPRNSQVPIILVGNQCDVAKRQVSLMEGEDLARKMGCAFLETSAKDGTSSEVSILCSIVSHLQKSSATTGEEALDELLDSLSEWHNLLSHLEDELCRSAKANTRPLVQVLPSKEKVRLRLWQNLADLQIPQFVKRQRSFPGIKHLQLFSGPRSPALQNQKANSVSCGTSQPSGLSDHGMLDGNYDHQVQRAFGDILTFLSRLGGRIRDSERKKKVARFRARIEAEIDSGHNSIDGEFGSEFKHNKDMPAAGNFKPNGRITRN